MLCHFKTLYKVESPAHIERGSKVVRLKVVGVYQQSTAIYIFSVDSEHRMRSEFVPDREPRTLTAAYIEHAVDVQVRAYRRQYAAGRS